MISGWSIFSSQAMMSPPMGLWNVWTAPLLLLLVAWSLVWKGLALWKAARRGEQVWFVVMLILNTAGILEILYLYVFSAKSKPVDK